MATYLALWEAILVSRFGPREISSKVTGAAWKAHSELPRSVKVVRRVSVGSILLDHCTRTS